MTADTRYAEATGQPLLSEEQAADYLGVTPACLRQRRHREQPPSYIRISSRCVRYRPEDLEEFLEARTVEAA